jgi:hypothetical protein
MFSEQAAQNNPHEQIACRFDDIHLLRRGQPLLPDGLDRGILDHSYH